MVSTSRLSFTKSPKVLVLSAVLGLASACSASDSSAVSDQPAPAESDGSLRGRRTDAGPTDAGRTDAGRTDAGRADATGGGGAGSDAGGGGTGVGDCATHATIQLVGRELRDVSGARIVARGPEMVVAEVTNAAGIDAAAAMGANAARFLLTIDSINGMTPQTFDALIGRAVSHHMILWISLFTWDSERNHAIGSELGGGNFYSLTAPSGTGRCSSATPAPCYLAVWSRPWLKDLMDKYKGHVIVDAMQEYIGVANAESEEGRTEWANSAKTNIAWFRSAGYTQPLEIMSNFQGRDLYAIVQKGQEIRASDPLVIGSDPQTMFGWQAYWASDWYKGWQGGLLSGKSITATQAIHDVVAAQSFPIEVGLDNIGGDTESEYADQMNQAAKDDVSWLWWAWTFGNNSVECDIDNATCVDLVTKSASGFGGAVRSTCGE
jgi:hypothetical protein